MKIYTTLHIGEFHTNHCEDYLITAELGQDMLLCAVMDGCSMGTDSFFASCLTGKLLRKIAKELAFKEFIERRQLAAAELMQEVMRLLFIGLKEAKQSLQLSREELLNTLVVCVINTTTGEGEFICVGDGLITIDGAFYEFEQDNRPDYLGYHLSENFEEWLAGQQQRLSIRVAREFCLATDGIFTFSRFDVGSYEAIRPGAVIDLLLTEPDDRRHENLLHARMIEIEKRFGLRPTDDLGVIRVILTPA